MKNCPKCGAPAADNELVCSSCGASLSADAPQQQPVQQPNEPQYQQPEQPQNYSYQQQPEQPQNYSYQQQPEQQQYQQQPDQQQYQQQSYQQPGQQQYQQQPYQQQYQYQQQPYQQPYQQQPYQQQPYQAAQVTENMPSVGAYTTMLVFSFIFGIIWGIIGSTFYSRMKQAINCGDAQTAWHNAKKVRLFFFIGLGVNLLVLLVYFFI